MAKLVLTTLCAGIHPNRSLPVVLDCGTDNQELLDDELYLGLRHKRVRGQKYADFVDSFVKAARHLYPRAYIHFEDFGLTNGTSPLPLRSSPLSFLIILSNILFADLRRYVARRILDKYRADIPCFNDDIQGTGCITLAAIMAGLHVNKMKLSDIRLVIFGAGSAGCGIAGQVRDAIATESGISHEEAAKQIW